MRRYASGQVIKGRQTTTGAFTLTDEEGVSYSLPSDKSVVLYDVGSSNQAATVGYDAVTVLVGAFNSKYGIKFPKGKAPAVIATGSATFMFFVGEVIN